MSIIDDAFAKENLPGVKRKTISSSELRGSGNAIVTETLETTIFFRDMHSTKQISLTVKFFVASNSTQVILGNDVPVTRRANINLNQNVLTFEGMSGKINLMCQIPGDVSPWPSARVKFTSSIAAQHMATVPVALDGDLSTEFYLLEGDIDNKIPLMVARSIGTTNADHHLVQAMNTSNHPVQLEEGQVLARAYPAFKREDSHQTRKAQINNMQPVRNKDDEFMKIVDEFNINPELSSEEKQRMMHVLYQNRFAFACGSRKLGQTDIVKMTLDTGDSPPISSPPYHASFLSYGSVPFRHDELGLRFEKLITAGSKSSFSYHLNQVAGTTAKIKVDIGIVN